MLCQHHEGFQDGEWRTLEDRRVADFQITVADLEATVQRHDRPGLTFPENHFGEMLADQIAQLGNAHDHPVVLLHEAFDSQLGVAVLVAEQCGKTALVIEQQAVLCASGEHVQAVTDLPEKLLRSGHQAVFAFREKALIHHGLQIQRAELTACDPEDRLDVAQSTRGALDVGLQVVLGVVVLGVACALFFALGQEELLARPHLLRAGDLEHGLAQAFGPGDRAAFHQVGEDRQIGTCFVGALGDRAYRLPDFQADIPEQREKAFDRITEDFLVAFV